MNRLYIAGFLCLFLFLPLSPAVAQSPKSEQKNTDIREYIKSRWPSVFKSMSGSGSQNTKPLLPTSTPRTKQASFQEVATKVKSGYEQRHKQYESFLGKLQAKRDKLAGEGKDVTKVDELLAKAKTKHKKLGDDVVEKSEKIKNLDFSGDPQTVKKNLGQEVSALKSSFKEMHGEVDEIVKALKETMGIGAGPKPTKNPPAVQQKKIRPTVEVPPPVKD